VGVDVVFIDCSGTFCNIFFSIVQQKHFNNSTKPRRIARIKREIKKQANFNVQTSRVGQNFWGSLLLGKDFIDCWLRRFVFQI